MVVFVPHPTERESVAQGLFWWLLTQGRSPHTPGISKNAYGPVGIPLFRGASGAGRLTKTPEGGKRLGGRPQSPRHTRPDLCRRQHGRPKCDPATECGHDREGQQENYFSVHDVLQKGNSITYFRIEQQTEISLHF